MLNLKNIKENIDVLVDKYNINVNDGKYCLDGDLEELFSDSNIEVKTTISKYVDWKYDDSCDLVLINGEELKEGTLLEIIELKQDNISFMCSVYAMDCGCGLDYFLDLNNLSLIEFKKIIVKSREEECGEEYFIISIPNYISDEQIKTKIEMACKYASESICDMEDNLTKFDEFVNQMIDIRHESNGQQAFEHYIIEICGWKLEPLICDYEYDW